MKLWAPDSNRRIPTEASDAVIGQPDDDRRIFARGTRPGGKYGPANGAMQLYEPILVLGLDKFANVDIRIRVSGGGHSSQIYAVRQALSKSLIAYYQRYVDEHSKNMLKQALVQYDRTLLVADNRRCEPKSEWSTETLGMWRLLDIRVLMTMRRVWWSRRPCQIPEVLPVKAYGCGGTGVGEGHGWAATFTGILEDLESRENQEARKYSMPLSFAAFAWHACLSKAGCKGFTAIQKCRPARTSPESYTVSGLN